MFHFIFFCSSFFKTFLLNFLFDTPGFFIDIQWSLIFVVHVVLLYICVRFFGFYRYFYLQNNADSSHDKMMLILNF